MCNKWILLPLILFTLFGCTRPENARSRWSQDNGKIKVLSTIAMIEDLVREIGGDEVDSIALINGELDPHSYELVKGDDEKFARADIIFYNGLGLEHGLSLRQNLENNPKAVSVADSLLNQTRSPILIVDGQYDPHVWMDIALWVKTVDPIVSALSQKDPEHAPLYRKRGIALRQRMEEVDQQLFDILQAVPADKRYLVTSHDAFNYFTRHYLAAEGESQWQERCRAPEGLAPEAQMSVTDVQEIIDHIKKYNITVLFPESNVSKDSLRKIMDAGRQMDCPIRICQEELYGDSMGNAGSYLDMIGHNVTVIARELN